MTQPERNPGSFRDPGGYILSDGDRIVRIVMEPKEQDCRQALERGVYSALADKGYLLPALEMSKEEARSFDPDAVLALEHPKLPFVSWPYEWCFEELKAAALLHLDMHLAAIDLGFTLCDATAYNIQFEGVTPRFIDHLSLVPYQEGQLWEGHKQFCMQFLNPLLLWNILGVEPNAWYRGNLEGIPVEHMAKLLPFRKKWSWTVLSHVVMHARLQTAALAGDRQEKDLHKGTLSKAAFVGMLSGLRSYISKMSGPGGASTWADYETDNNYSTPDEEEKAKFVGNTIRDVAPALVYDLGCNTGNYSRVALDAGARKVVGFDFDHNCLNQAFVRFGKSHPLQFTPVWLDASNPSPSQGWAQAERPGMSERASPDAIIALAFIHHLVIGKNVPMGMTLDWLTGLAPNGVIEFPDKDDVQVQRLLANREDIFPDYNEAAFLRELEARARVVSKTRLPGNGRLMVRYAK